MCVRAGQVFEGIGYEYFLCVLRVCSEVSVVCFLREREDGRLIF